LAIVLSVLVLVIALSVLLLAINLCSSFGHCFVCSWPKEEQTKQ
jgi:hypothetical protein